jgi:Protein of unknown function (DUF2785)
MLFAIVLSLVLAPAQTAHPKAFWQAIAKNAFTPPAGTTAAELAPELVANLGSPDPELRDELAETILTSWIYRKKLLGPGELRPMIATLRGNLGKGIGEIGNDGVLLRSFSALTLSVIAARDNDEPFLTAAEHADLLRCALDYFRDERDLRGFDADKGWIHSAAHTSDLLRFLARSARLPAAAQGQILAALAAKNRDAAAPFVQGEDERMARVIISIVRRADFDRAAFTAWLDTMRTTGAFPEPATVGSLRAQQNARHLVTALYAVLAADERPSEGAEMARAALRDALKALY